MRGLLLAVAALGLAGILVGDLGAQTKPALPIAPRVAQLEEQVASLQTEVAQLRQQAKRLEEESSLLTLRLQYKQNAYNQISLDLTSRQFQRLDTKTGIFLVSLQDVVPYLDGFKIVLDIGNPSNATYSGFKLKARWGKNYDWGEGGKKYTEASYKEWEKSIQEKEVPYTDRLLPGVWNKVELILASTKPDGLGFLEMSMDTGTISLSLLGR